MDTTPKLAIGDLLYIYGAIDPNLNTTYRYNGSSWVNVSDGKIIAVSKRVTDLKAYVECCNTIIANSMSTLTNCVGAAITASGSACASSRFEYGSILCLHGRTYTTGFGMVTALTTLPGNIANAKPSTLATSEFWITADMFKVVNPNSLYAYSPFIVNASTGKISFNGLVDFNNVANRALFVLSDITTLAAKAYLHKELNIKLIPFITLLLDLKFFIKSIFIPPS